MSAVNAGGAAIESTAALQADAGLRGWIVEKANQFEETLAVRIAKTVAAQLEQLQLRVVESATLEKLAPQLESLSSQFSKELRRRAPKGGPPEGPPSGQGTALAYACPNSGSKLFAPTSNAASPTAKEDLPGTLPSLPLKEMNEAWAKAKAYPKGSEYYMYYMAYLDRLVKESCGMAVAEGEDGAKPPSPPSSASPPGANDGYEHLEKDLGKSRHRIKKWWNPFSSNGGFSGMAVAAVIGFGVSGTVVAAAAYLGRRRMRRAAGSRNALEPLECDGGEGGVSRGVMSA